MKITKKLAMAGLSLTLAIPALAAEISADIFGKRMSPDAADVTNLRAVIGKLVAEGKIDKFEVLTYGTEGGFNACLRTNYYAKPDDKDLAKVQKTLQDLKVNVRETSYKVEVIDKCRAE